MKIKFMDRNFKVDRARVHSSHGGETQPRPPRGFSSGHQSQVSNLLITVFFLISCTFSLGVSAASSEQDLETRHLKSTSSDAGKKYEKQIAGVFMGSAPIMKDCLPLQKDLSATFVLYYVVSRVGKVEEAVSFPQNETSKCMEDYLLKQDFPLPNEVFVGKIRMSFQK
ncbi:MAG: hypothetical protein HQM16_05400 [Deltaproteobacteria bacterium]|nr:hypothetical protein [Deltaproteobacteria bacterium]